MAPEERRVCLGAFAGAHGVRGLVKVKSFTDRPEDLTTYGPLSDQAGTSSFSLTLKGRAKGLLLAAVAGVTTREAAQALKGTRLWVARSALPETEAEVFYHADLIGLKVATAEDPDWGSVKAVLDHGAGDILEVTLEDGGTAYLPFTSAAVPEVDLEAGRIFAAPPEEVEPEGRDNVGDEAPE